MASSQLLFCLFALTGVAAATENCALEDEASLLQTSAEWPEFGRGGEREAKDPLTGKLIARSPYKTLSDWKMNSELTAKVSQHPKAHKVYDIQATMLRLKREREENKQNWGWQEKKDHKLRMLNLEMQLTVAKKDLANEKAHLQRQTRAESAARIPALLPVDPLNAPPTKIELSKRYNHVLREQTQAQAQGVDYVKAWQDYNAGVAKTMAYNRHLQSEMRDPVQVSAEKDFQNRWKNLQAGNNEYSDATRVRNAETGKYVENPNALSEDGDSHEDRVEKMDYLQRDLDRGVFD